MDRKKLLGIICALEDCEEDVVYVPIKVMIKIIEAILEEKSAQ